MRWNNDTADVLTKTDSLGKYLFPVTTMATFSGNQVKVLKTGFSTQVLPVYTDAETGMNSCGDVILTRDAIIQAS